jgi:signal transduction histidine kinase
LIGRSIARAQDQDGDRVSEELARAFAMRAPFRDVSLAVAGEGLVAGEWKMSAVPAFEPTDGRFAGYRGIALRDLPAAAAAAPDRPGPELPDPDSLRELVHEIKTPLNAIIGFAEIIDGQFLGPADRGYRERAADIVAQARLLLGAIDDLDFAAKVHSGDAGAASRRVDLAELFASASGSLKDLAETRGVQLELARLRQSAIASVEPELADRLLYRLASAVIDRTQAGERVRLSVDQSADRWRVSITRPAALRGAGSALLSDAATSGADKGDAAATLQLRLVRGLARVAGGDLAMTPSAFTLLLPAARGA